MTTLSTQSDAFTAVISGTAPVDRNLRSRMARFLTLLAVAEAGALILVAVLAWQLRHLLSDLFNKEISGDVAVAQAAAVVGIWVVVLVLMHAYSRDVFAVGYGEYALLVRATIVALGCIGFYCYFTKTEIPRGFLAFSLLLGLPALLLTRFLARNLLSGLRRRGHLTHRAVVVGSPNAVSELLCVLRRETWTGYGVVGVCVTDGSNGVEFDGARVLGSVTDVADVVEREKVDTVVMAGGSYTSAHDLRRMGWALEGRTVDMLVAPTLTDVAGPRIRMRNVAGLPLVHVAEPSFTRARGPMKRAFDLCAALTLIFLISPLLLVVAACIKLHDRGPVFYRQTRVGVLGENFSMIKFRSMVTGADKVLCDLRELNEHDGVLFKIREDPRITPIGRFIRRYSIDELPQLFNVVRGDMSLVGPRPALPAEVENYHDDMRRRLLVQPGLTGLWQVSGRSDLSWEDAVRLDLYYVDNWSLMSDVLILAKTFRAVVSSRGAY